MRDGQDFAHAVLPAAEFENVAGARSIDRRREGVLTGFDSEGLSPSESIVCGGLCVPSGPCFLALQDDKVRGGAELGECFVCWVVEAVCGASQFDALLFEALAVRDLR